MVSSRSFAASSPIPIDVGRQLFVDDYLIDESTLLKTFHKATFHPNSPVLKPETPLELNNGVMPAAAPFGDGVWYDPKDKLFKIWYIGGYDDGFCYATSEDGIRWNRPNLDVVPGTNRVMAPIRNYMRNGASVWLDHHAKDPSERFKMFAYIQRGTGSWPRKQPDEPLPKGGRMASGYVYTSPDGIHWSKPTMTGGCGDNTSMFYNPFRKKWVFSIRKGRNGIGRARNFVEADDFVKGAAWKPEDVNMWLSCDKRDRMDPVLKHRAELYKVDCVGYESRMLGVFSVYLGPPNDIAYGQGFPKTNDLHAGFSRDGIDFERPDRSAFIACSRTPNTWNRGYLHPANGCCLVVGDQLRFYFAAFSGVSPAQGGGAFAGASTGMATLRRDGFASVGSGSGIGTLTTHGLTFKGKYMFVNADARSGELRVEALDEGGRLLPGFSAADCVPIKTDKTKIAVTWKGASDLQSLIGRVVKFRFHLAGTDLYSFWVSPDENGASHGYVGAGGPGFTGDTDTTGA